MQACLREEFLLLEPARNIYSMQKLPLCDMLPSYRTMKYKSPIWGYFHVQKK